MGKLSVFNFITINGFFKGPNEDLGWHKHGPQESEYAAESVGAGAVLLFGRKTYEMMASYWPTPMAMEHDAAVAEGMNKADKIVFSNTLNKADWNNTTIMSGDIVAEMKKLKKTDGNDMTILGSGSIVSLFTEHGLIDQYEIMVDPVAIGEGTPIFKGITGELRLELTDSRIFKSGVVLLSYKPKK